MRLQRLLGRLPAARDEALRAAIRCATAEELLNLAHTRGIELTPQEAGEVFEFLHPVAGELSAAELDAVTGGAGAEKDGPKTCPQCSGELDYRLERPWVHWRRTNPQCGYQAKQFLPG